MAVVDDQPMQFNLTNNLANKSHASFGEEIKEKTNKVFFVLDDEASPDSHRYEVPYFG